LPMNVMALLAVNAKVLRGLIDCTGFCILRCLAGRFCSRLRPTFSVGNLLLREESLGFLEESLKLGSICRDAGVVSAVDFRADALCEWANLFHDCGDVPWSLAHHRQSKSEDGTYRYYDRNSAH